MGWRYKCTHTHTHTHIREATLARCVCMCVHSYVPSIYMPHTHGQDRSAQDRIKGTFIPLPQCPLPQCPLPRWWHATATSMQRASCCCYLWHRNCHKQTNCFLLFIIIVHTYVNHATHSRLVFALHAPTSCHKKQQQQHQ